MKVYQYDGCSTCKKALKFLEKSGEKFESISIVDHPPTKAELKTMLSYVRELKKLFNTSGQLYREMKMSEKLPQMSEAEALELLSRHGKLVKRPFILAKSTGAVGFDEKEWKKKFLP